MLFNFFLLSDLDESMEEVVDSGENDEGDSDFQPLYSEAGTPDVTPQKKRARTKKCYKLKSDDEEDELLDWVQNNPCLWNRGLNSFKDTKKKDKLWHDKAKEKGYNDLEHIRGWWKDIKDQFVKLDKTDCKSGDGAKFYTDRQQYILTRVAFYRPCCTHRRAPVTSVSIPSSYFGVGLVLSFAFCLYLNLSLVLVAGM